MSDKSATPDQVRAAEKRAAAAKVADDAAKSWRGEDDSAPSRSDKPKGRRSAESDKS